ncbi:MAG: peptide ABC transporter substrate-binding protein [Flavonifractor sp.]|nr:peptide ABC transporter substrate-binding protein [Flavonifractor sp.]
MKKTLSLLLSLVFVVSLLAGCGNPGTTTATPTPDANPETSGTPAPEGTPAPSAGGPFEITLNIASEPQSIDPALNSAVDGAIMLGHMFEGLMKWKDSGVETPGSDGTCTNAELTEGQAESYEKVVNDDGTVTYTFKIRSDARWSDGKPVTAGDFVYSWQRLVTPETTADYNYMIDSVVNANEIMAGDMDPTELAVSAPDDSTFVVTLTSDLPYFLEVCAFPATFPVRQDVTTKDDGTPNDQWTFDVATYLCNGPYKLTAWNHNSEIVMEPNEQYYDAANLGPDKITFKLMDDQNAMLSGFNSGELDFIEDVPQAELPDLIASGDLKIVDYIGTYYVCYQTQKAPFDDPRVRQAFTLAVDRTFIVDKVTQAGQVPANGFVPAGVYDAAGSTGDDFRTVGGAYYSIEGDADYSYEANCEKARELLADAGYPNGEGFPVVEYLYNTSDAHKAVAEALQNMWETELGVKVTLNNQEWAVFLQTRKDGNYSIARNGWIADYNDPMSFLDMWLTGGGNNDAQYANADYDAKIQEAKNTTDPAARMQLMHEAENIIMGQDWALNPLYFYTQKYMLSDRVGGMFYTPLGYFFFSYAHPNA